MNRSNKWRWIWLLLAVAPLTVGYLAINHIYGKILAYRLAYAEKVEIDLGTFHLKQPGLRVSLNSVLPESGDEIIEGVTYKLELSLTDAQKKDLSAQSGAFFLEVPPFWGQIDIFLDDKPIVPLDHSAGSIVPVEIFTGRTYLLARENLRDQLKLKIVASGHRNLIGFRSDALYLVPEKNLHWLKLSQFAQNGIHSFYAAICVFIGLFGFLVFREFHNRKSGFIYLVIASIAMIPYHLMSSHFWLFFSTSPTFPFVVHIASQAVAIPFFIIYSLYSGLKGSMPKALDSPIGLLKTLGSVWLGMMAIGQLVDFSSFMKLAQIWFVILALSFLVTVYYIAKKNGRISAVLLAGLLFMSNLLTDLQFGSWYLLGHGAFAFSLIGLSFIVSSHSKNSRDLSILLKIVAGFVPRSIISKMKFMVNEGLSIEAIRHSFTGTKLVSIVFIDVCGYRSLRLKHKPSDVNLITHHLFRFAGRVLSKYDLELLKTMGDNIIFVGGLGVDGDNKPALIAEKTLWALAELIGRLPELNQDLKRLGLSPIEIKASASIGECNYYLKGTDHEFRFDLDGEPFIHSKHLEEEMSDRFYKKFGTNVASISRALFLSCTRLDLLRLFHVGETFYDKNAAPMQGMVFSSMAAFDKSSFMNELAEHPAFWQRSEEELDQELLSNLDAISESVHSPNPPPGKAS